MIRHHNPNRDAELARDERLPSQVWQSNEAPSGGLVEHLRGVHERVGPYRGAVVPGRDKPPYRSRILGPGGEQGQ